MQNDFYGNNSNSRNETIPNVPAVPNYQGAGTREAPIDLTGQADWVDHRGGETRVRRPTPPLLFGAELVTGNGFSYGIGPTRSRNGSVSPEHPEREEPEPRQEIRHEGRLFCHEPRFDEMEDWEQERDLRESTVLGKRAQPETGFRSTGRRQYDRQGSRVVWGSDSEEFGIEEGEESNGYSPPGYLWLDDRMETLGAYPTDLWGDEPRQDGSSEGSATDSHDDDTFGSSPYV